MHHRLDQRLAAGAPLVRVLDDQDGVLGHQPDQHDEPDLGIDVDRHAQREQREQRAEHRERNRDQDREWVDEALELARQHQEDEHQGDHEQQVQPAAGLGELARFSCQIGTNPGRQGAARDRPQIAQGSPDRHAGGQVRGQGRRAHPVEVVELLGCHLLAHLDHARHLDQAFSSAHVEAVDHVGRRAITRLDLEHHLVLLVAAPESGHLAAAQQGLERVADVAHRDPERGCAVSVDVDLELWLVEFEIRVHVEEIAELLRLLHHHAHGRLELVIGLGLQHELHRAPEPTAQARWIDRNREHAGNAEHAREHRLDDLLL